jgi:hypothetical protein
MRSIGGPARTWTLTLHRPLNEVNASTSIWATRALAFTSETFLLSFSLPNFSTPSPPTTSCARGSCRLGKRDYEGWLRTKMA